jgi:hypothetical protein
MAYFGTFIVKNDALVKWYFSIENFAVHLFPQPGRGGEVPIEVTLNRKNKLLNFSRN